MYRGKGIVGSTLLPSPMSDDALTRLICKNSIPSIPFPFPSTFATTSFPPRRLSLLSVSTLPYDLPPFLRNPFHFPARRFDSASLAEDPS